MPKKPSKFIESFTDDDEPSANPSSGFLKYQDEPNVPNTYAAPMRAQRKSSASLSSNNNNIHKKRSTPRRPSLVSEQSRAPIDVGNTGSNVEEQVNNRRSLLRKASMAFKRHSTSSDSGMSAESSETEEPRKRIHRKRSIHSIGLQIAASFKPMHWKMFSKTTTQTQPPNENAEERVKWERREHALAQYAEFKQNMRSTYCGPPGSGAVNSYKHTVQITPEHMVLLNSENTNTPPSTTTTYRQPLRPSKMRELKALSTQIPAQLSSSSHQSSASIIRQITNHIDTPKRAHVSMPKSLDLSPMRQPVNYSVHSSMTSTGCSSILQLSNGHTKHDSGVEMDEVTVFPGIKQTSTSAEKRLGRVFLDPPSILKRKRSTASVDSVASTEDVYQLAKTVKDLEAQLQFARQQLAEASAPQAYHRAPENPFALSRISSDFSRPTRLPTIFSEGNLNDYIGLAVTTNEIPARTPGDRPRKVIKLSMPEVSPKDPVSVPEDFEWPDDVF